MATEKKTTTIDYDFFTPNAPIDYCLQLLAKVEIDTIKFDCLGLFTFLFQFQGRARDAISAYVQTPVGKAVYDANPLIFENATTIGGVLKLLPFQDFHKCIEPFWRSMDFTHVNKGYRDYVDQVKHYKEAMILDDMVAAVQQARAAGVSSEDVENTLRSTLKMFEIEAVHTAIAEKAKTQNTKDLTAVQKRSF